VVVTGFERPCLVRADPERIQQVLTNLLDNAGKNSPVGSRIEVTLSVDGDGTCTVEVSDRGAGMTEEELVRAFDKFSRGRHGTVQGTGLGLYICRKIIDAHDGQIWAKSRDGGGAIVGFSLSTVRATDDPAGAPGPQTTKA
jgi:two-component system sensor histidine kinase KdpD